MNKDLKGSPAEVMHGSKFLTTRGGLTKKDLTYTSDGRIVSKKHSVAAKKNPGIQTWLSAVAEAKKKLKIPTNTFTPISGKLLDKARQIHKKLKK